MFGFEDVFQVNLLTLFHVFLEKDSSRNAKEFACDGSGNRAKGHCQSDYTEGE